MKITISGERGEGKTTLAAHLAKLLVESGYAVRRKRNLREPANAYTVNEARDVYIEEDKEWAPTIMDIYPVKELT